MYFSVILKRFGCLIFHIYYVVLLSGVNLISFDLSHHTQVDARALPRKIHQAPVILAPLQNSRRCWEYSGESKLARTLGFNFKSTIDMKGRCFGFLTHSRPPNNKAWQWPTWLSWISTSNSIIGSAALAPLPIDLNYFNLHYSSHGHYNYPFINFVSSDTILMDNHHEDGGFFDYFLYGSDTLDPDPDNYDYSTENDNDHDIGVNDIDYNLIDDYDTNSVDYGVTDDYSSYDSDYFSNYFGSSSNDYSSSYFDYGSSSYDSPSFNFDYGSSDSTGYDYY